MTTEYDHLFQYLRNTKVKIDKKEFVFQVKSHPDHPSLLAISDTLTFFKIKNYVFKVPKENYTDLPKEYLAFLKKENKGFLSHIIRDGKNYKFFSKNSYKKISSEQFYDIFQDIVLLVDQKTDDKPVSSRNYGSLVFKLLLLFSYSFLILQNNFSLFLIGIITILCIGMYLSVQALFQGLGVDTGFSSKICTSFIDNADCSGVINSTKENKLLKNIDLGYLSSVFFLGQLIALLFLSLSGKIVDFYLISFWLTSISIPITLASIIYQKFIIKKWCTICLLIITIIYLEFFVLLQMSSSLEYFSSIWIYLMSYILSIGFMNLGKSTFKDFYSNISALQESNRFKRTYSLFKSSLANSMKVESGEEDVIDVSMGNPNSNLSLTIITNPFCSFCASAHLLIEEILDTYKNDLNIKVKFKVDFEYSNDETLYVTRKLMDIYMKDGETIFLQSLHDWYEDKNISDFMKKNGEISNMETIDSVLKNQQSFIEKNNLNFTPVFIVNDRLYPEIYEREDLKYFLSELLEDKDLF